MNPRYRVYVEPITEDNRQFDANIRVCDVESFDDIPEPWATRCRMIDAADRGVIEKFGYNMKLTNDPVYPRIIYFFDSRAVGIPT